MNNKTAGLITMAIILNATAISSFDPLSTLKTVYYSFAVIGLVAIGF